MMISILSFGFILHDFISGSNQGLTSANNNNGLFRSPAFSAVFLLTPQALPYCHEKELPALTPIQGF
jgi:hypothetical protein